MSSVRRQTLAEGNKRHAYRDDGQTRRGTRRPAGTNSVDSENVAGQRGYRCHAIDLKKKILQGVGHVVVTAPDTYRVTTEVV